MQLEVDGCCQIISETAWQNHPVPVLTNRPVLAAAFLVVKYGRQDKAKVPQLRCTISA